MSLVSFDSNSLTRTEPTCNSTAVLNALSLACCNVLPIPSTRIGCAKTILQTKLNSTTRYFISYQSVYAYTLRHVQYYDPSE